MADDLVVRLAYIEAHIGELDIPDVEWLIAQLRAERRPSFHLYRCTCGYAEALAEPRKDGDDADA